MSIRQALLAAASAAAVTLTVVGVQTTSGLGNDDDAIRVAVAERPSQPAQPTKPDRSKKTARPKTVPEGYDASALEDRGSSSKVTVRKLGVRPEDQLSTDIFISTLDAAAVDADAIGIDDGMTREEIRARGGKLIIVVKDQYLTDTLYVWEEDGVSVQVSAGSSLSRGDVLRLIEGIVIA